MKPRVTVLTIGVDDLERAVRFYRDGLGLATEGIIGERFEHGAVAFFNLQAGLSSQCGHARVLRTIPACLWQAPAPRSSPSGTTFRQKRTSMR